MAQKHEAITSSDNDQAQRVLHDMSMLISFWRRKDGTSQLHGGRNGFKSGVIGICYIVAAGVMAPALGVTMIVAVVCVRD